VSGGVVRYEIQTDQCPFTITPLAGKPPFSCLFNKSLTKNLLGTLGPRQKQEITFTFTPEEAKVIVATILFKFSGAEDGIKVLKLSAIGKYPFLTINHEKFDFETLLVGKVSEKDVILKNNSLVPAEFNVEKVNDDGKDPSFSIDNYSGIVPPNASFKITVKFVPSTVGMSSCT
jgi:hypothetical protein